MPNAASIAIRLTANGRDYALECAAGLTAAALLRDLLGLTGTKIGCGVGECGACTVLIDDEPLLACLLLAAELDGRTVTTIEGLATPDLSPLQRAFVALNGAQCGFCTPGMILAATVIAPGAHDEAIRAALAGNLCRCTGYRAIIDAVILAGQRR